jgi:hypothetical protein
MGWVDANASPQPMALTPIKLPPLDQTPTRVRVLRPFLVGDQVLPAESVQIIPRWLLDDVCTRVEVLR